MNRGILYALLAAVTFGASTPFAKLLVGAVAPLALAGLLYLGSGLGLLVLYLLRGLLRGRASQRAARLQRADLPWLGAAILFGGVAGPVLLMVGLTAMSGASASLLLNLEGVLTSLLAWFVFKENFDRRILLGMLLIVAGGAVLAWQPGAPAAPGWGALAVALACLCWAIDNNLTRKVADSDAVQIACIKGLVAGAVNLTIAIALHTPMPPAPTIAAIGVVGFCGYGLSLVLFVLALRTLGSARSGAYFSAAPFVGVAVALLLGESPAAGFWLGGALMAAGIALHLTERHAHLHTHAVQQHAHSHRHDAHHQHQHAFGWDGVEPHTHPHGHEALSHSHAHFPDSHHRHTH